MPRNAKLYKPKTNTDTKEQQETGLKVTRIKVKCGNVKYDETVVMP